MNNFHINGTANFAGLYTLSMRWVIGWTYFSAFWRRLVLENKLIPEEAGYIGEKFNHFLPNALFIKSVIEYLVSNPEALQISMISFTIIEAIVGFCIIIGLFTRLMSIGVFMLAMGILLGSGWLGTTCLDEWQIGVLGIAAGFTLFLTGSSAYSIDQVLVRKKYRLTNKKWFLYLGSGNLPLKKIQPLILIFSIFIFGITLFTNQYFHGGVLGTLHNKSVKPKVEISKISFTESQLKFQLFRVEGADVYGSFLIGIEILNETNQKIHSIKQNELANLSTNQIHNYYVAKIRPGKHSLVLPLGAKADIVLDLNAIEIKENYKLKLIDISGIEWITEIN